MRISWLLAVLILASGCAMIRPTDPYAGMAEYGLKRPPDSTSRLSTRKNADGPVTLDQCIAIALKNNPDPRAAAYEASAAKAQRDIAVGRRFPSVNLLGGYNHYLDSQRMIPAQENFELGVFSRDILAVDLSSASRYSPADRLPAKSRRPSFFKSQRNTDWLERRKNWYSTSPAYSTAFWLNGT